MRGKEKCKALKEIRRQIAQENDIPYAVSQCTHQGDCRGTCPKCEAELRYLERELAVRQGLGKAVAVVGISASVCAGLTACSPVDTIKDALGIGVEETAGTLPAPEGKIELADPEDIAGGIEEAPDFGQDGSEEQGGQGTEESQETESTTESSETSLPEENGESRSIEGDLAGAIPAPEEIGEDIVMGEILMPEDLWSETGTEMEGDIALPPDEAEDSPATVAPTEGEQ